MDKRFDDHAEALAESREDVRTIRDRLDKGQEMFSRVSTSLTKIEMVLTSITKAQAEYDDIAKSHGRRLTDLEADQNVRKGERGVWAAILNSKAAAWVAAAIAAGWALVASGARHVP